MPLKISVRFVSTKPNELDVLRKQVGVFLERHALWVDLGVISARFMTDFVLLIFNLMRVCVF